MNANELSHFYSLPYFTTEAVKQFLGADSTSSATIHTSLYRWMKAGRIIKLKNGIYMTRQFFEAHRSNASFPPMVSAILLPQSYISLEYILQQNGILSVTTYPVTAITPKQTRLFENMIGTFSYRNIKLDLYHGFSFSEYMGITFQMASVAKALFDYLYLRRSLPLNNGPKYSLADDLRLNLEDFSERSQAEFAAYVEFSHSRKMEHVLNNLRKTIWRP